MDQRDRDQFKRLDANDELIVQLQRGMLTGTQQQAKELDQLRLSIELQKLEPQGASTATKAKAIGTAIGAVIVIVAGAAIQNGWFSEPKKGDPKESPIPISTYR
jgi:hypothetical protein